MLELLPSSAPPMVSLVVSLVRTLELLLRELSQSYAALATGQEPVLPALTISYKDFVLAGANLILLGVGLAATQPRRASNWNLLIALLSFIVYFNLINLSKAWIAGGRFGMGPAMLGLHGTALLLGLGLIWWRDHAAVRRPFGAGRGRSRAAAQPAHLAADGRQAAAPGEGSA